MHRLNSINFGKFDNSNLGTHLGMHRSVIFNIVRQMAAPRLSILPLVIFLSLLTRTYSHRPIILRFQEVNKKCKLASLLLGHPVLVFNFTYSALSTTNLVLYIVILYLDSIQHT